MSSGSLPRLRVLHCPTNIAGQMWEYVKGLRGLGVNATALTFARHPFGYPDDVCLDLSSERSVWRRRIKLVTNLIRVIQNYGVIHFHFGETLLPRYLDLPLLRALNKKMVMNYWGSEVRLRNVAANSNPFYNDIGALHIMPDVEKIRRVKQVSRFVQVAIVADYELHDYISPFFRRVAIIPQAVSSSEIEPYIPQASTRVPLVVHAPSKEAVKGTAYVEAAVARLKKRHHFDFLLLKGMTNRQVKEALAKADIVIDQLLLGTYGVFSVEAMAMGKPVICYIRPDLVEKYPEDLPIVRADPETIESVLEKLLTDGLLRRELGMRSRAFSESYHDSRVVATKLVELYESL